MTIKEFENDDDGDDDNDVNVDENDDTRSRTAIMTRSRRQRRREKTNSVRFCCFFTFVYFCFLLFVSALLWIILTILMTRVRVIGLAHAGKPYGIVIWSLAEKKLSSLVAKKKFFVLSFFLAFFSLKTKGWGGTRHSRRPLLKVAIRWRSWRWRDLQTNQSTSLCRD